MKNEDENLKRRDTFGVIDLTIEYILDKLDEAINATYTL